MLLMSTERADGIFEPDIPSARLVTASVVYAIILETICLVLAIMLRDNGVDHVELGVDIPGGISNNGINLLVRQRLMAIQCLNRFLSSFQ